MFRKIEKCWFCLIENDERHFCPPSSWQFNSTNEFRDVPQSNVIVDDAVSVVSYVPRDESDYGTLLCWGRNELGRQRRPCVFHVIPAGE